MTLQEILESVKSGSVSVEEAERILKKESYEEMGYAKLDTHREIRSGFAEVIFCARKADEHLLKIFTRLYEQDGEVFGTRASEHQYELIRELLEPEFGAMFVTPQDMDERICKLSAAIAEGIRRAVERLEEER